MTPLGKAVIISGILIFTASTLAWIITGDWQWFAGGGSIFFSSLLASAVLSAETKRPASRDSNTTYIQGELKEKKEPPTPTKAWTEDDPWSSPSSPS